MKNEAQFNPDIRSEQPKQLIEQALWRRAEDLSEQRERAKARQEELYKIINTLSEIRDVQESRKLEDEYWQIQQDVLPQIIALEGQTQELLLKLDEGQLSEQDIAALLEDKKDRQQEKESGQKQKENRTRYIADIWADPWDAGLYGIYNFGFEPGRSIREPNRLTTGRHAKHVKGAMSPKDAADEFFYRTADTHGGKVKHGKKGDSYTSKSGKRIRKK